MDLLLEDLNIQIEQSLKHLIQHRLFSNANEQLFHPNVLAKRKHCFHIDQYSTKVLIELKLDL
jgi:hypothetical protein